MVHGVYVAAITPRRSSGDEIDLGATFEVIDFLGEHGVDGIALLGSTGEFLHFDLEERSRLISLGRKRSRVPVLANVSHSTLDGSIRLAQDAIKADVEGLLLMPPYFFRYEQLDIQQFFMTFAAEVGPTTPIYLYNIPLFTNELAIESAVELLSTGLFAGIKDSSGDWDYLCRLRDLRERVPFTIIVGSDSLFARAYRAGAEGVISGVACAVPELLVALFNALRNGQEDRAWHLGNRLEEFVRWISRFPVPVGIKAAVQARGLDVGRHALPLSAETHTPLGEFRDWFRPWLRTVQKECADG
jgi:dihydrodipicolinate synthase/N-acetylneuraminate lyase